MKKFNISSSISQPCPISTKYLLISSTFTPGGISLFVCPPTTSHCFKQAQNSFALLHADSFSEKYFCFALHIKLFSLFLACLYLSQSSASMLFQYFFLSLFLTLVNFIISLSLQGAFFLDTLLQTIGASSSNTWDILDEIKYSMSSTSSICITLLQSMFDIFLTASSASNFE